MTLLTISKEEMLKRLKSLAWRAGMMLAALVVGFLIENLGVVELPPTITMVVGLILGELSKQINKNLQVLKGLAGK